jgi:hypothetical protein
MDGAKTRAHGSISRLLPAANHFEVSVFAKKTRKPDSIAVGDLNGDGKPDLVVTIFCPGSYNPCQDPATVGVLRGNGDGTFQLAVSYEAGAGAQGAVSVVIADVNGDRKPDLIVADCGVVVTCSPVSSRS